MGGRQIFRYAGSLALVCAACSSFSSSDDSARPDAENPPADGGLETSAADALPDGDASARLDADADVDVDAARSIPPGGKRVFVTAGMFKPGNTANASANIAQADGLCRGEAVDAGLPSVTYVAWLSTAALFTGNAIARLNGGKWFLVDGTSVATLTALASGKLDHAIDQTAFGAVVAIDPFEVWTGTLDDGTVASDTCSNWISSNGSLVAVFGDLRAADGGWTVSASGPCQVARRVYCFEL